MKLQISFDLIDLDKAISIGSEVAQYADVIEVGTILIYHHGIAAVKRFKQAFPDKIILADTKIVDRGKEVAELFVDAGADWITVMAGTSHYVIHATTTAAHNANIKVMLDLIDSDSVGQSALEAKNLGVDALLFHQPYSESESLVFLDKWDMIKGNSSLPIFVSAKINRDNVDKIIALKPDVIIVGVSITDAEDSASQAHYFSQLISAL
ncbi:MAG TPA: orotidine 5'-phosphate decarboxylase / HUMPS family protein [Candidatus Babeliales bacterium]|nr:orotidine 5'-phosphate decarboxylase / HUMPS family protein [Candidatus Babeliales bacterium]